MEIAWPQSEHARKSGQGRERRNGPGIGAEAKCPVCAP